MDNTAQPLRQNSGNDKHEQPPPPYVREATGPLPPYLTLHVHTTSSSGSIVFRTDATPRVLYEIYNPKRRRHFRRLSAAKPSIQIISMKRNLIICDVHLATRREKHPGSMQLNFPVTGHTTTYSSGTPMSLQHGNSAGSDKMVTWILEESTSSNADAVKTCRDSNGFVLCQAIMNPLQKTARIEIARPCSNDEELDELVAYCIVQIEVYCNEYRKIDRLLTESGF